MTDAAPTTLPPFDAIKNHASWLAPSEPFNWNGNNFDPDDVQARVDGLPQRAIKTLAKMHVLQRREQGQRNDEQNEMQNLRERWMKEDSDAGHLAKLIERSHVKRTEETDATLARHATASARYKIEHQRLFNRRGLDIQLYPCIGAIMGTKGPLVDAGFTATPSNNQSVQDAIDERAAAVAAFESKKADTAGKKLPLVEAIAVAHADIDDRAATNPPTFGGVFNLKKRGVRDRLSQGSIRWPIDWKAENIDTTSLMFWLFADELKARATAELTAMFDPADSIDTNMRRELLASYDAEILRLDYESGALAELTPDYVKFRSGMPPLAILGVKVAD